MTEPTLTPTELDDLRWLAGMIVPPSTKYGVPGAGPGVPGRALLDSAVVPDHASDRLLG